jgi:hypothetical protein
MRGEIRRGKGGSEPWQGSLPIEVGWPDGPDGAAGRALDSPQNGILSLLLPR